MQIPNQTSEVLPVEKLDADTQLLLEQMLQATKKRLKPESKNNLIRIACALIVENFALKAQLAANQQPTQEEVKND
jgi:hypothetical protein